MIIAGIDYSMSSPALCIFNSDKTDTGEFDIDGCTFYAVSKRKTIPRSILKNKFNIIPHVDSMENMPRFVFLANTFVDLMKGANVEHAAIEGYAMGIRGGRSFNIGENGGILKSHMYDWGVELNDYTPSEIKKFATGKGGAKKCQMHDSFVIETGIDLQAEYGFKTIMNPVDDLVDAYYIAKMLWFDLNT